MVGRQTKGWLTAPSLGVVSKEIKYSVLEFNFIFHQFPLPVK